MNKAEWTTNEMKNNRREFLWQSGGGLGGIALAAMLDNKAAAGDLLSALEPVRTNHPPKAKRVIQLFMAGAASQVDLFDYKPELFKRHGQPSELKGKIEAFQDGLGPWLRPIWDFAPHGQSGKMLGSVVAPLGKVVDEIAFVHNMTGKTGIHSQATYLQATGFQSPGFPGMGCWASYGLGSLNQNLPTFVVLPDHRGYASNGPKNWDNAFLPGQHQGTILRPGTANPLPDLFPNQKDISGFGIAEKEALALLVRSDRGYGANRTMDLRMESRIKSYELAAAMQLAAGAGSVLGRIAGIQGVPRSRVRRRFCLFS